MRRAAQLAVLLLAGLATAVAALQLGALRLPSPDLAAAGPASATVTDRDGRLLRVFTTPGGLWRMPVAVADVDQRYIAMLLGFEDRRFRQHGGIDARAGLRILAETLTHGRVISGGSTLTMQVARIIDRLPTRSATAKWRQATRAIQLERRFSKDEILALYLLHAPFGGNIEGVRAASLAYFGHEPNRLNSAEAALLVALPQAPLRRRPDRDAENARAARNRVLRRAAALGVISAAEAEWATRQPVPTARHAMPALAPHLAERVAVAGRAMPTTLDAALQARLEPIVRRHAELAGPRLSAALLAVDTASGEVLAAVGSPGSLDEPRAGGIDMTLAVRSPGSALKPFVTGLAFDLGIAHPATLIEDAPAVFGDYAPRNFDGTWRGTVTAAEALQWSLNIPAVRLLEAVGPATLAARLRDAGLRADLPRNLSVALGGAGLTLRDMAALYATLARGGRPLPLRDTPGAPPAPAGRPLLGPAAAWAVTRILREAPAPRLSSGGAIAFKTGTSYGFRDAWAAGYDGRHTLVVWLGRPDMTATPALTGLTHAAPLLFEAFAATAARRAPFVAPPVTLPDDAPAGLARLPAALSAASTAGQAAPAPGSTPLRIAFPPRAAQLEMARDEAGGALPILLRAQGGQPPLRWLADGAPLVTDRRGQALWQPPGRGFARLSVIDAAGSSARVEVRIR